MMEEEEETLFDQEGLLGRKEEVTHEKREWKRKLLKTATLSMSFFCLGLCIAIPGPTLLDLGRRVNHDTEHMTFIFTARSIGYLIGALAGGIMFDFFNQQILLFYTIAAAAIATAMVPWSSSLFALSIFICVHGVALGVLDTGGNVYCIKIWGLKSAPFMQILHFAFGIGAFLAPLIARPFLMDMTMISENVTRTNNYHPVSFNVPYFDGYNRIARDVAHFQSLGKSYLHELNALNTQSLQLENGEWISGDDNSSYKRSSPVTSNTILEHQHNVIFDGGNKESGNEAFPLRLLETIKNFLHSGTAPNDYRLDQESVDATSNIQTKLINFRVKRQQANLSDGGNNLNLDDNNTHEFDNQTEHSQATTVIITTTLSAPTPPRPRKPGYSDGEGLSKEHADGADINSKIKDLKNNPPAVNDQVAEVTTVASTTRELDINLTSVASATESGNTSLAEAVNDTHSDKDVFTAANTTTVATITDTTTAVITKEPTTTETASTTSTTVATTTVYTSTTISRIPSTSNTETSSTETSANPTDPVSKSTEAINTFPTNSSTDKSLVTKVVDFSTTNSSGQLLVNKSNTDDYIFGGIFTAFTGMSKIQLAYTLISMLLVTNAGLFLFLYCKERLLSQTSVIRSHEDLTRPPDTKCFVSTLIILLFFFFFSYVGMEVTFGGLLTTFAVYYPSHFWTSAEAAMLTALFWGSIAVGRCFAICIARYFKPPCMMVANLFLTVLGALLLSFTVQTNSIMLWVGTVLLGLGMSSLFPTAISWANCYYPLTGRATAVFVAGSGVGEMVIPVMTGYLFDKVNRMAIMYMTLVLSTLMSFLYMSLQLLVFQKGRSKSRRSHSGFMRLNNSEDMADAVDMDTVDFAEGGVTDIGESTRRRKVQDEVEKRLHNGDKTTELIKLVELSD